MTLTFGPRPPGRTASENADFPRTSTSRQLYSEFDSEAYRELGSRAVRELLGSKEYRDKRNQALLAPVDEQADQSGTTVPES